MDELARGLIDLGRTVTVLTRGRKSAAFAHDEAHPAHVIRLPGHGWVRRHQRYLRWYAPFLSRHLRDHVVHAATFSVAHPLLPALSRSGAKLVLYAHGLELVEARGQAAAQLSEVLARAALIVANSQRVRQLLEAAGAAPERIAVVAPAIDPARLVPEGPDLRERWNAADRPVILTLGRLIARKGQDTMLRALPLVRRALPSVLYVIAGRGPDQPRLEALVSELGLGDAVRFAGFVSDDELGAAYRASDLYVMVPRETEQDLEGFGITYLEAGACGRAVIGAASGGVEDAIAAGITGVIVPPDSPEALAREVIALLGSPDRRAALGANGRRRVERELSHRAMAERIARLSEAGSRPN